MEDYIYTIDSLLEKEREITEVGDAFYAKRHVVFPNSYERIEKKRQFVKWYPYSRTAV